MVYLREQEGLNRTSEQLRAMTKLFLEEPHIQEVTGTCPLELLGYSAIRGEKTPQLKPQGELPLLHSSPAVLHPIPPSWLLHHTCSPICLRP